MCISRPNLPSRDTFWNSGPAGQCFRVGSPGLPSHPRARRYRRYLEVVLLAMLRVYLLPTPRVDRYRGFGGEDRRLGCGPVTHLVRGGPSSGLAGLGRTGLSGSSLPVPLGPGPAILHARSFSEVWAEPGTRWRGPPPWASLISGGGEETTGVLLASARSPCGGGGQCSKPLWRRILVRIGPSGLVGEVEHRGGRLTGLVSIESGCGRSRRCGAIDGISRTS
jgi:hypothetical protein